MSESRSLKDRFKDLSPGTRIWIMCGGLLVVAILGLFMMPGTKPRGMQSKDDKPLKAQMLLPRAQDQTLEQVSGGLTANEREVANLKRELSQMKQDRRDLQKRIDDALGAMGKGKKDEKDDAKWTAARRWVAAVNAWGKLGHWDHEVCFKRSEVRLAIGKALTKHSGT